MRSCDSSNPHFTFVKLLAIMVQSCSVFPLVKVGTLFLYINPNPNRAIAIACHLRRQLKFI